MSKKVLIAEDQPDSRRLLQDVLARFQMLGVETVIAREGSEALSLAEKHKPELILLDIMMPKVNGFDVCRQIKSNPALKKSYVIMVSAKIQPEDRKEAALAGADEYLTKPYDVTTVIERVQKVLGVQLIS